VIRNEPSPAIAAQMIRNAAIACAVLAAVALIVFALIERTLAGVALAVGLLLGAGNGLLAARLFRLPLPFVASSLARLVTLSMIGVAIGFALGVSNIWLVILGLGASQFVLAASAVRAVVNR
jgi:hypothetical protein